MRAGQEERGLSAASVRNSGSRSLPGARFGVCVFLWGAFAAQEFHTDVPLAFGLRGVSSLLLFDGSCSELRDGTASRFRTSSLAQRLEPPARVSILSGTSARSGTGSTGGFSHGVVLCVPSLAKSARLFSASLGRCLRCSGH